MQLVLYWKKCLGVGHEAGFFEMCALAAETPEFWVRVCTRVCVCGFYVGLAIRRESVVLFTGVGNGREPWQSGMVWGDLSSIWGWRYSSGTLVYTGLPAAGALTGLGLLIKYWK